METEDDGGVLLASPYLHKENTKSGDKCLWIGEGKSDTMWTEKCDSKEAWQIWNLEPVKKKSDKFYLVNAYNGKCVKPISNGNGYLVQAVSCTSDSDMAWKWFDGQ